MERWMGGRDGRVNGWFMSKGGKVEYEMERWNNRQMSKGYERNRDGGGGGEASRGMGGGGFTGRNPKHRG